jgi:hypothetical protein
MKPRLEFACSSCTNTLRKQRFVVRNALRHSVELAKTLLAARLECRLTRACSGLAHRLPALARRWRAAPQAALEAVGR